jgi:hypothetical protein
MNCKNKFKLLNKVNQQEAFSNFSTEKEKGPETTREITFNLMPFIAFTKPQKIEFN